MKHLIFFFVGLAGACSGRAQFSDTTNYFISYAGTGVINQTNNSRAYVLSNVVKFSARHKRLTANTSHSYVYGWQQHQLTNNDLSSTLDFNLYASPRFYYWGLGALDKSYSLKINNRFQTGLGAAYTFLNKETAFFNISDGLLYEASNLKLNDTTNNRYHTLRNSLRVRHRFVLNRIVVLDGTHFWQPSLKAFDDYIIKSNLTISVKLRQWLSLSTTAVYNNVRRTDRETLLVTFGVLLENYF